MCDTLFLCLTSKIPFKGIGIGIYTNMEEYVDSYWLSLVEASLIIINFNKAL